MFIDLRIAGGKLVSDCVNCKKTQEECTCRSEKQRANWDWEKFSSLLGNNTPKTPKFSQELTKKYTLSIIDDNSDSEWGLEYRTEINILDLAAILEDYFHMKIEAFPKYDVVGVVDFSQVEMINDLFGKDEEDDEDEE